MTTEIGSIMGIEDRRQIAGGLFFIDDELDATFWDQFERFDDHVIERATEACRPGMEGKVQRPWRTSVFCVATTCQRPSICALPLPD
jgi:hypothetical protein